MAPIHHHFEQKGWSESTIVIRFWIISIILAMIGLATLKLRLMKLKNETLSKNFLIYGFGKSGISSLKYLKRK